MLLMHSLFSLLMKQKPQQCIVSNLNFACAVQFQICAEYSRQVLSNIRDCKNNLNKEVTGQDTGEDPTRKLLLLYEFEAVCRKKSLTALETVYERALSQPNIDAKYLELLVSLAQESGMWCGRIIIRLNKAAIAKHMASPSPDMHQVAKNYCIMTQVLFEAQQLTSLDPYNSLSESFEILWGEPSFHFPELELAWLVVKYWNCGVLEHSAGRVEEAEKWCALAQKLVQHSSIVKETFQEKIKDHLKELFPPK